MVNSGSKGTTCSMSDSDHSFQNIKERSRLSASGKGSSNILNNESKRNGADGGTSTSHKRSLNKATCRKQLSIYPSRKRVRGALIQVCSRHHKADNSKHRGSRLKAYIHKTSFVVHAALKCKSRLVRSL